MSKTIVATGCSSGLGFEAVKYLLGQKDSYRFILGCRNVSTTQKAFDELSYDAKSQITFLPLELSDLRTVRSFAQETLKVAPKVDYLLLNAALIKAANEDGPNGSRWTESHVVNHLSQHFLLHLLRDNLVSSNSRIVFVSSGAIKMQKDTSTLEKTLTAKSGAAFMEVYPASKFVQLLGAHYWRRTLGKDCTVVAVSPGMIPGTGLGRHSGMKIPDHPDAKSVPQGGRNIVEALFRDDLPEDKDRIFLTSWGEWWPREEIALTCDKDLQDKWSPSLGQIEKTEKTR